MREIWRAVLTAGVCSSVLGMAGMAWLCSAIDFPVGWIRVLAAVPLLCGAVYSGILAGRRHRHHGLYIGGGCGALLTALWYCGASIWVGRLMMPFLFCVMIPAGMAGGAVGVNLRPYAVRRRLHAPRRIGSLALLRLWGVRKPPKYEKQTSDV